MNRRQGTDRKNKCCILLEYARGLVLSEFVRQHNGSSSSLSLAAASSSLPTYQGSKLTLAGRAVGITLRRLHNLRRVPPESASFLRKHTRRGPPELQEAFLRRPGDLTFVLGDPNLTNFIVKDHHGSESTTSLSSSSLSIGSSLLPGIVLIDVGTLARHAQDKPCKKGATCTGSTTALSPLGFPACDYTRLVCDALLYDASGAFLRGFEDGYGLPSDVFTSEAYALFATHWQRIIGRPLTIAQQRHDAATFSSRLFGSLCHALPFAPVYVADLIVRYTITDQPP
jgi:hypothetical protein